MKIYWTKKSIPELTNLPPIIRNKNYKDAYSAISTHIEYWIGAGIALAWILFFFRVYDYLLPGQNNFPRDAVRTLCVVCPGVMIWNQFAIYGMRKHYRHILQREGNKKIQDDSERLICKADAEEYEQWRHIRRYTCILLVVIAMVILIALARTTR